MRIALIALLCFAGGVGVGSLLLGSEGGVAGRFPDAQPSDIGSTKRDAALVDTDGTTAAAPSGRGEAAESTVSLAGRDETVSRDPTSARARRAWALGRVRRGYKRFLSEGEPGLPPEFEGMAARDAEAWASRQLENGYAGWLAGYARKMRATRVLSDPPTVVFQVRGSGRLDTFAAEGERGRRRLRDRPLDLETPPHAEDRLEAYCETGVVPLDRVLLIERIEVTYSLGCDPEEQGRRRAQSVGRLRIEVDGARVLDLENAQAWHVRGDLRGRKVIRPPWDHPEIQVDLAHGVVGLVAHGRYVSKEEGEVLRDRSWVWAPEGDDGLVGSEPVLLQVRAGHGGGNPNTVALDGSRNMYVDGAARSSLWDDAVSLRSIRNSLVFSENGGAIPDGHVYRITRIDWRARLDPKKGGHSQFRIRSPRGRLVERTGKEGEVHRGTWTGEVDLRPGQERRVFVECAMYAMGEAIVHGTLVKQGE